MKKNTIRVTARSAQNYKALVPFNLSGLPCLLGVTGYNYQPPFKGPARLCDSDVDFYGYEEIDFELLDRKGYRAKWLDPKMSSNLEDDAKIAISEYFQKL